MHLLKDIKSSHEALAQGLKENGQRHKCYGMYTSMDRAMCLLLTGNLYITNGRTWNDKPDRELMRQNNAYGICFSCSTLENIAMWMLYSGDHGKNGALMQFPPAVIQEILETGEIEIGGFDDEGKFAASEAPLRAETGDYDIFLTDVVYTDELMQKPGKPKMVRLSLGEDHEDVPESLLKGTDVFCKNYAWNYERECRLIIRTRLNWPDDKAHSVLKVKLSDRARRALTDRVVRSPIFEGKVDFGKTSKLCGKVDWNI